MNHGRCKNCWWYKMLHGDTYQVIGYRLIKTDGSGICYMHTVNPGTDIEEPSYIGGESWCPDYINRERYNRDGKQTLVEWLNEIKTRI